MSGRHRNDFPDGADDDGHDPGTPVFGPANDGSSDWFATRDSQRSAYAEPPQGPPVPGPPPGPYAAPYAPQGGPAADSGETPHWFTPRHSSEEAVYGSPSGEYSGPAGTGGFGTFGQTGSSAYPAVPPVPPMQGPARGPGFSSAGTGYGEYDSIRSSDGGPTGFFGGRAGPSEGGGAAGAGGSGGGGPGGPGGSGGSGGSGGHGTGEHGTGGHGRRKRKRSAAALIGPMAGAVGLALLLGVGVYAFAESGGGCGGDGALTLSVAAAPDIEPVIVKAAERFNGGKHEVGGRCVRAEVHRAEPASVATLLSGQGVANPSNRSPDVWIPDSSLWTALAQGSGGDARKVVPTKTSVASSPIVVGLPETLAGRLRQQGVTATPSWDNLLKAAGGVAGGAVTKNQMIPAGSVRLLVPDPTRNAAGMGSLMITNALLANDPNRESIFTGIVRTVRESTVPTVPEEFTHFRKDRPGKQPISLSSEQALWSYNRGRPAEPAVALYPIEGTLSLDYPFTVTSDDGDKQKAAGMLERAMGTERTRGDVRDAGFRSSDGKAPSGFGPKAGVSPARPRQLPVPKGAEVAQVMQAWSKLSLGLRILTLIDVSGSMAEEVGPRTNRLQAIAQVSQGGLSMMSNDTELGQWLFSTDMVGKQPYRETVSIGPLGERVGSNTRRNLVLSMLNQMKPKPNGDTGLYRTMLAAYRQMNRTYKPEFGNSILLLTDGKNDDPDGPSLAETLKQLKAMQDPNKPIQVNMIGFGKGVDRGELEQIAAATNGNVQIAMTPQEVSKIFLKMLSRRITS
ncbi:substrate-binding domain-containing protein [Actinomadura graeca]|uniref:Substrate-binding domain-containing protein n=1 Tax=Actinomadura graeca TaxID=2750812 RepID=A0ABX8QV59_9ACTN|nr:substrate-binding domain-containing protein [Actinomadura graeca]QXJ21327.1 substrate-binding domain-containing protein [Actinomadura graeca]